MQQIATVSIPKPDAKFFLTKKELFQLKKLKIINSQAYFYLAILCSYGEGEYQVEKKWFCGEWNISEEDFDLSLAQLQKKGLLQSEPRKVVQMELIFENL